MRVYSADEVANRLPYLALICALREAFAQDIRVPTRLMYSIPQNTGSQVTFGLMPAWQPGGIIVTKLVTIFPHNTCRGLPTIHAQMVIFDGTTGVPVATLDGTEVTRRRTAATSALAASYLARQDAEYLVVVGTGPQAMHQALAHAAVRPIRQVGIWGRSLEKASAIAEALQRNSQEYSVNVVESLESAIRAADVVSCATSARDPIVFGAWLKPGAFLDLVGSHTAERRECDDEVMRRSRIYVETYGGAVSEAGDLLIPLQRCVIEQSAIVGDLRGLCCGQVQGRGSPAEITLFKSVGFALEDLAAAQLVISGRAVTT